MFGFIIEDMIYYMSIGWMIEMDKKTVAVSIREFIDGQAIVALATTALDGTPNVAPMFWKNWFDEKTLLVLDNHMRTTKSNILATGIASLSAWDASTGAAYQVKGVAEYVTSGTYFEAGAAHMSDKKPGQQPKGVVVLHVASVYTQQPGEQAGSQLDMSSDVSAEG